MATLTTFSTANNLLPDADNSIPPPLGYVALPPSSSDGDDATIGAKALLHNIPSRINEVELLEAVQKLGFSDDIKHIDMPHRLDRECRPVNKGFAFVHFFDAAVCEQFAAAIVGFPFECSNSPKAMTVEVIYDSADQRTKIEPRRLGSPPGLEDMAGLLASVECGAAERRGEGDAAGLAAGKPSADSTTDQGDSEDAADSDSWSSDAAHSKGPAWVGVSAPAYLKAPRLGVEWPSSVAPCSPQHMEAAPARTPLRARAKAYMPQRSDVEQHSEAPAMLGNPSLGCTRDRIMDLLDGKMRTPALLLPPSPKRQLIAPKQQDGRLMDLLGGSMWTPASPSLPKQDGLTSTSTSAAFPVNRMEM